MADYSNISIYLSTKLWFGKYKGKSIYELIQEDIKYTDWLFDEPLAANYKDDKVKKMFNEYWERKNNKLYGFRNDNLNK